MEHAHDFDYIIIRDASENNLKHINVRIPKRQITVVTGVSGSGKSSLVMDTIAAEDYQNRTFVLMLESKGQDEYVVAAKSDDIVTQGKQDATIYYGDVEYKRYHFVVLTGKDNKPLLETTFKRQGKVKFVQEFEFVDFKTPNYPTSVICKVVSSKIPQLQTVAINQEPDLDSDWFY